MPNVNLKLHDVLMATLGSRNKIATLFNVSPQAVSLWKKTGVPERIALLCHLSEDIPYIFNPSDYGVDNKGRLKLNLETTKKVMTNDSIK